jgi:hypothetical protein
MPEFNGRVLWQGDAARGGALLYLSGKPAFDVALSIDGASAELIAGSPALLISGINEQSFESCLRAAISIADRALDVMAAGGSATVALRDPGEEHILWLAEPDGPHLRLWVASDFPMPALMAKGEARHADGTLSEKPEEPKTEWHESFRYFRLAQVTDDLFDAFRNLYLAVESLLGTIAPQLLRPSGRPGESESDWFKRAMGVASQHLDLAKYTANEDSGSALDEFFDEMYVRTRSAVFHAKAGRPVIVPMDMQSRPAVADALARLARFYVDLSAAVLGIRYGSGGWSTHAFHEMAGSVLRSGTTLVTGTAQAMDTNTTELAAAKGERIALKTRLAEELNESFFAATLGEALVKDVIGIVPVLRSAVLVDAESSPLLGFDVEGELGLDGFHRLSVVLGIRGRNTQMLRSRYGT